MIYLPDNTKRQWIITRLGWDVPITDGELEEYEAALNRFGEAATEAFAPVAIAMELAAERMSKIFADHFDKIVHAFEVPTQYFVAMKPGLYEKIQHHVKSSNHGPSKRKQLRTRWLAKRNRGR